VGDTVYGYDGLRMWLEEQDKNYVLAVPETHMVWVQGRQQPVGLEAALLPEEAWVVLSAAEGSKGPRLYEWAWLQLPEETETASGRARWVLIRRSLSDPSQRAYYRASGSAQTTLPELVRVTGSRWQIEEGYEQTKGEVGLDQYEVRMWHAWYRYVTLALLAYAVLVVMQQQARAQEKKWCCRPARRAKRARGASFTAGGRRGGGIANSTTALVALSTPAPRASSALPSAAPCTPGTRSYGEPVGSSTIAGGPCPHGRALGAAASLLACAEATDGPSRHRSSPHRGGHCQKEHNFATSDP
jgi:hypothetical protein